MDLRSMKHRRTRTRSSCHLPGEIITEILRRLPFDAILRCKLVSKEWKNIINDPTFYMHYRDNNSTALFMDRDRLYCLRIRHDKKKQLTNAQNPHFTVHQIPMGCEEDKWTHTHSRFEYGHCVFNWGSSKGIACVAANGHFYFYNLVTGSAALHTVTDAPMHQRSHCWMCYGFGHDGYDDDYKILVVCNYKLAGWDWPGLKKCDMSTYTDQNEENTLFWVYSFKKHGWKSFNDFPYPAYASDWGAYPIATTMNGVLHWLAPHDGVIVTYDLHTGRFGEVGLPSVNVNVNALPISKDCNLHELNGRLCYTYKMVFDRAYAETFDVWGMVGDSWAKLVSIDCSRLPGIPWCVATARQTPLVLHESTDGRIFVLFMSHYISTTLIWYDLLEDKFETFRPKVWLKQRIQHKRSRTRVKRKTGCVVKN